MSDEGLHIECIPEVKKITQRRHQITSNLRELDSPLDFSPRALHCGSHSLGISPPKTEEHPFVGPRDLRGAGKGGAVLNQNSYGSLHLGYGHGSPIRLTGTPTLTGPFDNNQRLTLLNQLTRLRDKTLQKMRSIERQEEKESRAKLVRGENISSTPLLEDQVKVRPIPNLRKLRRLLANAAGPVTDKEKSSKSTNSELANEERRSASPWSELDWCDNLMDKFFDSITEFFDTKQDRVGSDDDNMEPYDLPIELYLHTQ